MKMIRFDIMKNGGVKAMEIRVLRYFLTVVREESITKAAEALHITQPTLSRQLAQMEEDMGVRLFDRGTRKIVLTNEGILLRRRADEILELVDKTRHELASWFGEEFNKLAATKFIEHIFRRLTLQRAWRKNLQTGLAQTSTRLCRKSHIRMQI